jgi:tetratricopeptide (TPR) repeat protein
MPRLAAALLAAACAGLLPTPARAMLTDPAQIMNEAYIQLVQGDQSLDAGRLEEAFAFYEQAREHYERLAREFPGFEPRIIQYRKTYCDNQITGIRRKQAMPAAGDLPPLEARAPARIPPEPAVAPPGPAVPAATGRSVEIDYLNSRIDSLEAGRLDEAFAFYEQAREHYERLAREFPGFEPRIIQYRKT